MGGIWHACRMSEVGGPGGRLRAGYFDVDDEAATAGNLAYWSGHAEEYLAEFGDFLGEAEFRWCPEGLLESAASAANCPVAEPLGAYPAVGKLAVAAYAARLGIAVPQSSPQGAPSR